MPNSSQAQNQALPNRQDLWRRITEVLGTESQTAIAGALGVSVPSVAEWKKGTSLPKLSMLMKIAELGNTSTDYLLRGEGALGDASYVTVDNRLLHLLQTIAAEQAQRVYSDAQIAGQNTERSTLRLLVDYLLERGLREFGLMGGQISLNAEQQRRAERFSFVKDRELGLAEQITRLVDERVTARLREAVANQELLPDEVSRPTPLGIGDLMWAEHRGTVTGGGEDDELSEEHQNQKKEQPDSPKFRKTG